MVREGQLEWAHHDMLGRVCVCGGGEVCVCGGGGGGACACACACACVRECVCMCVSVCVCVFGGGEYSRAKHRQGTVWLTHAHSQHAHHMHADRQTGTHFDDAAVLRVVHLCPLFHCLLADKGNERLGQLGLILLAYSSRSSSQGSSRTAIVPNMHNTHTGQEGDCTNVISR